MYLSLFVFSLVFVNSNDAHAQLSVNVNIGNQPLWGPVGYDYARYYYMPEIDVYYDVNNRKYTYWKGNKWITKSHLPGYYKNFDVYRTYKVVVNDNHPWYRHQYYKGRYSRYAHNHRQVIIRDHRHKHHKHYHKRDRDYDRHHRDYDRD